tara:strand:+ start:244 stop:681 length:438 start_codon:yes stop_codon:yes gene_type:complete
MKLIFEDWKKFINQKNESYPRGEKEDVDGVAKVIIFNEEDKILILKRAAHMNWMPGKWDLPGGHLKKEETAKQAIKREVKEETGLTIKKIIELGNINQITIFKANAGNKNKELSLDDENADYKWISPAKVSEYDFVPFLKDFIKS